MDIELLLLISLIYLFLLHITATNYENIFFYFTPQGKHLNRNIIFVRLFFFANDCRKNESYFAVIMMVEKEKEMIRFVIQNNVMEETESFFLVEK